MEKSSHDLAHSTSPPLLFLLMGLSLLLRSQYQPLICKHYHQSVPQSLIQPREGNDNGKAPTVFSLNLYCSEPTLQTVLMCTRKLYLLLSTLPSCWTQSDNLELISVPTDDCAPQKVNGVNAPTIPSGKINDVGRQGLHLHMVELGLVDLKVMLCL